MPALGALLAASNRKPIPQNLFSIRKINYGQTDIRISRRGRRVGAGTAFQVMFFQELLRGRTAQEALLAAQLYVANDPHFGDLSVPAGEIPPSKKFHLRGHDLSTAVSKAS